MHRIVVRVLPALRVFWPRLLGPGRLTDPCIAVRLWGAEPWLRLGRHRHDLARQEPPRDQGASAEGSMGTGEGFLRHGEEQV